jgi:hypothetical protein
LEFGRKIRRKELRAVVSTETGAVAGADTAADEEEIKVTFRFGEGEDSQTFPRPWARMSVGRVLVKARRDEEMPPYDKSKPVVLHSKGMDWDVAPRNRGVVLNPGDGLIVFARAVAARAGSSCP